MHTLYLGPSWAVQSFESWHGDDEVKTNLAQELQLENFTNLASNGDSNMTQLTTAQKFMTQNPDLAPFRVVWLTANTLTDSETLLNIDRFEFARWFIGHHNVIDVVQDIERKFYQHLEALEIPVALIGAHTDVVEYAWNSNVTVIHSSWQNFLATQCGLNSFFGWPAEVAHLWLTSNILPKQGPIAPLNLERSPSESAVFEITKLMRLWDKFQRAKLWYGVHPNIRANKIFANAIRDSVTQWLGKTQ